MIVMPRGQSGLITKQATVTLKRAANSKERTICVFPYLTGDAAGYVLGDLLKTRHLTVNLASPC
mgnify:CR=1 FL=1